MDKLVRDEAKALLLGLSELNLAIANILEIQNPGGNMSEVKETVTEAVATVEPEVVVAPVVEEVAVASEKTEPVVAVETAEAAVVEKKEETSAEASLSVTDSKLVVDEKRVYDNQTGDSAVVRQTTEVVVNSYVPTEPAQSDAAASEAVVVEPVVTESAKQSPFSLKFTAEASDVDLSDEEKTIANDKSFIDLVKVVASLTQEVVQYREQAKAAELERTTEARFDELSDLGISLDASEGSADRTRIASMDEKAFAAYRDGVQDLRKAVGNAPVVRKDTTKTLEQAKASLDGLVTGTPAPAAAPRKTKFAQI